MYRILWDNTMSSCKLVKILFSSWRYQLKYGLKNVAMFFAPALEWMAITPGISRPSKIRLFIMA